MGEGAPSQSPDAGSRAPPDGAVSGELILDIRQRQDGGRDSTKESATTLGPKIGARACALVKASHIILAVEWIGLQAASPRREARAAPSVMPPDHDLPVGLILVMTASPWGKSVLIKYVCETWRADGGSTAAHCGSIDPGIAYFFSYLIRSTSPRVTCWRRRS